MGFTSAVIMSQESAGGKSLRSPCRCADREVVSSQVRAGLRPAPTGDGGPEVSMTVCVGHCLREYVALRMRWPASSWPQAISENACPKRYLRSAIDRPAYRL